MSQGPVYVCGPMINEVLSGNCNIQKYNSTILIVPQPDRRLKLIVEIKLPKSEYGVSRVYYK
jgi:hypothetical protein